jgi:hypothetical protein
MHGHPVIRTFIKDSAMTDLEPTKNRKPSDYELNDEELEKTVGGDGRNSAKGSANNATKDPPVRESISFSYSSIAWAY